VEVTLDAKEDAEFTQERILTIAGTVAQCMNFTSMILRRLVKSEECIYVINGTTYPKRNPTGLLPASSGSTSRGGGGGGGGGGGQRGGHRDGQHGGQHHQNQHQSASYSHDMGDDHRMHSGTHHSSSSVHRTLSGYHFFFSYL
jgi:phage tail tape-measure protein